MTPALQIDPDVLAAAEAIAARRGKSTGEVLSELARLGLERYPRPGASPITPEMVRRALDDD